MQEENVVAINSFLFNYALNIFPKDVIESIQQKIKELDLPRLDGNRYGAANDGITVTCNNRKIFLNHPLGLCEAYVAWRYSKFAHTDINFLNHAIAAICLRGVRTANDREYDCHEGDFEGGNFYLCKWGIKVEMTGIF